MGLRLPGGLPVALEGNVIPLHLMIRTENISLRSAVRVIRAFAARETVLVVAVAAALASCALVPPDVGYAAYVDWHTLALLFCLMAVVAGFRSLGVLDAVGAWLVARARTQRAVAGVLVGLAFFASMAVTNDVALITFVPLALVVLRRAGMEGRMCLVATLMTIAANLGSMFTPVGNPQNLYLFTASGMGVGEFLQLMGPYTAASGAMLALACVLCFRGGEVRGAGGVGRFASLRSMTPPIIQRCRFRLRAGRPRKVPRLIACPPAQGTGPRRRPRRLNPLPPGVFPPARVSGWRCTACCSRAAWLRFWACWMFAFCWRWCW